MHVWCIQLFSSYIDEIEKYNYTGLSIAYIVVNYPLLLLAFLLTIIEWKGFIKKMKVLLHMKNDELSASNLTQLNVSRSSNSTSAKLWERNNFKAKTFLINFYFQFCYCRNPCTFMYDNYNSYFYAFIIKFQYSLWYFDISLIWFIVCNILSVVCTGCI